MWSLWSHSGAVGAKTRRTRNDHLASPATNVRNIPTLFLPFFISFLFLFLVTVCVCVCVCGRALEVSALISTTN